MILSDRDLRQRLGERSIVIEPLSDIELQLQPASIDLRLGSAFRRSIGSELEATEVIADGEDFVLQVGEFALGSTVEVVHVPSDLVARVEGRSSVGRLGVIVNHQASRNHVWQSQRRNPIRGHSRTQGSRSPLV